MRISDWSSDVCSSDLQPHAPRPAAAREEDVGAADAKIGAVDRLEGIVEANARAALLAEDAAADAADARIERVRIDVKFIRQAIEISHGKLAKGRHAVVDRKSTRLNSSH